MKESPDLSPENICLKAKIFERVCEINALLGFNFRCFLNPLESMS